jgi:hypothetical protein
MLVLTNCASGAAIAGNDGQFRPNSMFGDIRSLAAAQKLVLKNDIAAAALAETDGDSQSY